jgi:hypothetical protein
MFFELLLPIISTKMLNIIEVVDKNVCVPKEQSEKKT